MVETSQANGSLRHVVIGVGAGIFPSHHKALTSNGAAWVAVSDVNVAKGRDRAAELDCPFYADHRTMLAETQPDVAVVITPHPFHAPIAIDCLQSGCHVLVEKPMSVHVAEADAMIEAAERAERLLAVNFQMRLRPEVRMARRMIEEGRLGMIQHVNMTMSWTRAASYFKLSSWRGTWTGEGGGVLMNQSPHNLDLLCYLIGLPKRVVAWTRTRLHQIETEDTAQAMLEWPDGALGFVHVSTSEAGQPETLDIVGTQGHMRVTQAGLTLQQFVPDIREFLVTSPDPFGEPEERDVPVQLEPGDVDHVGIYRNLHDAILRGAPLNADGGGIFIKRKLF